MHKQKPTSLLTEKEGKKLEKQISKYANRKRKIRSIRLFLRKLKGKIKTQR